MGHSSRRATTGGERDGPNKPSTDYMVLIRQLPALETALQDPNSRKAFKAKALTEEQVKLIRAVTDDISALRKELDHDMHKQSKRRATRAGCLPANELDEAHHELEAREAAHIFFLRSTIAELKTYHAKRPWRQGGRDVELLEPIFKAFLTHLSSCSPKRRQLAAPEITVGSSDERKRKLAAIDKAHGISSPPFSSEEQDFQHLGNSDDQVDGLPHGSSQSHRSKKRKREEDSARRRERETSLHSDETLEEGTGASGGYRHSRKRDKKRQKHKHEDGEQMVLNATPSKYSRSQIEPDSDSDSRVRTESASKRHKDSNSTQSRASRTLKRHGSAEPSQGPSPSKSHSKLPSLPTYPAAGLRYRYREDDPTTIFGMRQGLGREFFASREYEIGLSDGSLERGALSDYSSSELESPTDNTKKVKAMKELEKKEKKARKAKECEHGTPKNIKSESLEEAKQKTTTTAKDNDGATPMNPASIPHDSGISMASKYDSTISDDLIRMLPLPGQRPSARSPMKSAPPMSFAQLQARDRAILQLERLQWTRILGL